MQPRDGNSRFGSILALVIVAGVSFFLGTQYMADQLGTNQSGAPIYAGPVNPPEDVDFTPLWRTWAVLEEKYVPSGTSTDITRQDMLWGAVEGLAQSLDDPYTVFLPPSDNEIFTADISGEFEGVGMEIGMRDGFLTVVAPLKGTPAEAAGLRAGDRVIRIDGEATENLTIDEAVMRIRGEKGTEVVLTVAREGEGELLDIPVVRDVIDIPTIETTLRDDNIFVIELYNFSAVASDLFREALRTFVQSGSDKLILDLRGNPGGFLDASVEMASWFIPAGEVILTEDFGENGPEIVHRSRGYDIFDEQFDMVILIDQGSASASEILAGALSQYDVATLVGQTTFGKGSVQELVGITEETSLKVTIARWLTPDGTTISDNGLEPDIEVEMTIEDIEADEDPQLDAAVEYLLEN